MKDDKVIKDGKDKVIKDGKDKVKKMVKMIRWEMHWL